MSALAKTSTANAQATQHRTSPFSTASPSTCSNRTKPANAESTENASRPVGTMTTYFNSSDIKMRLPWGYPPFLTTEKLQADRSGLAVRCCLFPVECGRFIFHAKYPTERGPDGNCPWRLHLGDVQPRELERRLGMGLAFDRNDGGHPCVGPRADRREGRCRFQPRIGTPSSHGRVCDRHWRSDVAGHLPACAGSGPLGRRLPASRRSTRREVRDALLPQCDHQLWACESESKRTLATLGSAGGAERMAPVRADDRFSVRHDRESLVAPEESGAPLALFRGQSFRLLPEFSLLHRQLVSNVVLVDVGNVSDRLLPNVLGRDQFHVVEPDVGIEARIGCLFAQPHNAVRPGIVAGKDKQRLVQLIDLGIIEVPVINVAQHLDAGMNVAVGCTDVRNVNGICRRVLGYHLHDAHRADGVLLALVQQRLLVALGSNHQVVEVIL